MCCINHIGNRSIDPYSTALCTMVKAETAPRTRLYGTKDTIGLSAQCGLAVQSRFRRTSSANTETTVYVNVVSFQLKPGESTVSSVRKKIPWRQNGSKWDRKIVVKPGLTKFQRKPSAAITIYNPEYSRKTHWNLGKSNTYLLRKIHLPYTANWKIPGTTNSLLFNLELGQRPGKKNFNNIFEGMWISIFTAISLNFYSLLRLKMSIIIIFPIDIKKGKKIMASKVSEPLVVSPWFKIFL